MKSFVCDICKISVGEYELHELHEYYKIDEINHICKSCNDAIEGIVARINEVVNPIKQSWIKHIILKLRNGG